MKPIYGVLGRSLKHSWSPMIHHELGCPEYICLEREPEQLKELLTGGNIGGLNVTIPYKQTVMQYCDLLSESVREIGSINTLVQLPDGSLAGYNTDADGFLYMVKRAGISLAGKKVLIFGGGGAQLAVRYAARRLHAAEIVTVSRSGKDNYENLFLHTNADILINTTPLGMYPYMDAQAVDVAKFPHCCGVLDLIYNPRRTNLLLQAEALEIPSADGLPMLVDQARHAEQIFRGVPIPEEETERILGLLAATTRNIVLIGMPGCGKSTVGKILSRLSGMPCYDTDDAIVDLAGKGIPQIFAEDGEARFRELERQVIAEAGSRRGMILITGGGAVVTPANAAPLRRMGRVYHLERELSALAREGRPLSVNADLRAMYENRLPLYEQFRDVVIANNHDPEQTAALIWRDFCEHSCN